MNVQNKIRFDLKQISIKSKANHVYYPTTQIKYQNKIFKKFKTKKLKYPFNKFFNPLYFLLKNKL